MSVSRTNKLPAAILSQGVFCLEFLGHPSKIFLGNADFLFSLACDWREWLNFLEDFFV